METAILEVAAFIMQNLVLVLQSVITCIGLVL